MRWSAVVLVALVGCDPVANPRSCLDGACTDPSYPYCDVEGFFEQPGTCIAVECVAGELKGCRGDLAITCNSTGNNFDLVDCPNGCDASGCIPPEAVDCTTNGDCANPAPICGAELTCRGCLANDECSSTVCERDTGACTAESAVVYASPTGSASADCTLATPCTIERAVTRATVALGRTMRLLPGSYTSNLDVAGNVILKVEATGAVLGGGATVSVTGGARVDLYGLKVTTAAELTLTCGDLSIAIPKSTLRLTNVDAGIDVRRCNLTMQGGQLYGLLTADDASLDADGVKVTYAFPRLTGQRLTLRFVNSIFEDNVISLGNSDTVDPGSSLSVAFSTFVYRSNAQFFTCNTNANSYKRKERFENSIFVATADTARPYVIFMPRSCEFANNITFPQDSPIAGNIVMDPQLVDIGGRDYHLQQNSPAVNAGLPSVGLSVTRDFDGLSRPQGTAPDLGAFEKVP